jgi:hypothetical protein
MNPIRHAPSHDAACPRCRKERTAAGRTVCFGCLNDILDGLRPSIGPHLSPAQQKRRDEARRNNGGTSRRKTKGNATDSGDDRD